MIPFPKSPRFARLVAAMALSTAALMAVHPLAAGEEMKHPPAGPQVPALERLKALAGDWVDADAKPGAKDGPVVTYRVTGAGSAVVETLFAGTPHEMVSVFHRDGTDLVMTHYCSAGNQPRMRTKGMTGNVLAMDYDGGTNLDPSRDSHIHSFRLEFVSPDEIREDWVGWDKGKPAEPVTKLHLKRRKG
jgi:hypothetical protein